MPVENLKIRRRNGKHYVFLDGFKLSYTRSNINREYPLTGVGATRVDYDNYSLREPYDRIIRCLGFAFNESLFSQLVIYT